MSSRLILIRTSPASSPPTASACSHRDSATTKLPPPRLFKAARTVADSEENSEPRAPRTSPKRFRMRAWTGHTGRSPGGRHPRRRHLTPGQAEAPATFASRRTLFSRASLYAADFSSAITSSSVRNVLNAVLRARCSSHDGRVRISSALSRMAWRASSILPRNWAWSSSTIAHS